MRYLGRTIGVTGDRGIPPPSRNRPDRPVPHQEDRHTWLSTGAPDNGRWHDIRQVLVSTAANATDLNPL